MSGYAPKAQTESVGVAPPRLPNLDRLEDRVRRVAETIEKLKKEKAELEAALFRLKTENTKLYNSNRDLTFRYERDKRSHEVLDKNREEIKHRLEVLIDKLEGLEG